MHCLPKWVRVALINLLVVLAAGSATAGSVTVEAESGTLGSEWSIGTSITILTPGAGNNPASANRVATYSVTFPTAGNYDLYARVYVGPSAWSDDSMFIGNGFGAKSPTTDNNWIFVNGLAGAGYTAQGDVVGGAGTAGGQVWKWLNLTQFTGQSAYSVGAGNLTQTFQIGAREDGLQIDKLLFGQAGYVFTVAELNAGGPGTEPFLGTTIDTTTTYQTIEGIGGAICFYNGWFPAHPNWQRIADEAFSGLNISMLRLGNWWSGTGGQDTATYQIVDAAKQRIGDDLPILMSSWSPPAYLKSNGEKANGGTLIKVDGQYAYDQFADYWYESLQDYAAHGIVPTWIGIQNEPDWTADYESCRFNPTEALWNGTNYASYALAVSAVYQNLQTNMAAPPKLLGPECVGLYGNGSAYRDYVAAMNPNHYYGTAHHLYGGSTDGTPDGYNSAFNTLAAVRPEKPRFMTEFGDIKGMIECANLIHNSMVVEQVSGYNQWSLIWPGDIGLVEIENPWDRANWTNPDGYWLNPAYWSMKHYSYYIRPGYQRVAASSSTANILSSAYLSPDGNRLVAVFVNRSGAATIELDVGDFAMGHSSIYQSTADEHFVPLGEVSGDELNLPAASLTTVVMDRDVAIGPASNPSPAEGAQEVPATSELSWTAGSNAVEFAVYVGTDSNAVASATTQSPEYQGIASTNRFATTLPSGSTVYWRVDGVTYSSVGAGPVWSFQTEAAVPGVQLKFNEGSGTVAADSSGNGNNASLVNGAGWTAGKYGTALSLDGANDYAALPSGVVGSLEGCTISTWVYLDTISTWSRIFDFGSGTSVYMFLTPRNGSNNRVRFAIKNGGGEQIVDGTSALPTGVWTHVAVTLNGTTGTLYINGSAAGTAPVSLTPSDLGATTQNWIGRSQWPDPYLDGRIDDFRVYPVALTAADISAIIREVPPNTPASLSAAAISASQIDLSWAAATGTDSYTVHRSTSIGDSYAVVATNVVLTNFSDTLGLDAGTRYYYVVSAVNLAGASGYSPEANAVPSLVIIPDEYYIADHAILGGTNLSITVSNSVPGHLYWVLATESLSEPDWQLVGVEQAGTGSALEFSLPMDGAATNSFFKLDVDRQ